MTRVAVAVGLVTGLAIGGPAWAQDSSNAQDVRPAVTSFWGDTGLWFVPTAEVLKKGGWAFGAYRTEMEFKQGSTDASFYPGTFAIGAGSRAEIFGAVRAVTAIDRDTRPLFSPATTGLAGSSTSIRWSGTNGRAATSETCTSGRRSTCSRSTARSRWRWRSGGR